MRFDTTRVKSVKGERQWIGLLAATTINISVILILANGDDSNQRVLRDGKNTVIRGRQTITCDELMVI